MTALRLGTRGSTLARWQADWVAERLRRAGHEVEVAIVRTAGDRDQHRPLDHIGVGVFTRELDEALLASRVDAAVHSLKDIPTGIPSGLRLVAVPCRDDPRDALVTPSGQRLDELPPGAVIGTSSPRRRAQLHRLRPDLRVEFLRGNVETRLRRVRERGWAGTILAVSGLRRLGLAGAISEALPPDVFLPAVGQGAIGIVTRDAGSAADLLATHDDTGVRTAIEAERGFLSRLGGGCHVPAGAHAHREGSEVALSAFLAGLDGTPYLARTARGPAETATRLGHETADWILETGGQAVIMSLEA